VGKEGELHLTAGGKGRRKIQVRRPLAKESSRPSMGEKKEEEGPGFGGNFRFPEIAKKGGGGGNSHHFR